MGLGSIVDSVANKAREIANNVENKVEKTVSTVAEKAAPTISQFNSAAENMTSRLTGGDPLGDITRTAVKTVTNLPAPALRNDIGGILGDIGDFGKGLLDRGRDFVDGAKSVAGNVANRVVDSGRSLVNGFVESTTGLVRSVVEGGAQVLSGVGQVFNPAPLGKAFSGDVSGAWSDFKNNFTNGISDIGGGFIKGTVQAAADTAVVGLSSVVSAVQTRIGLEQPSRALTEQETAELRKVYGDSIDYSQIRIKEGFLGVNQFLAPHTIGNTIYVPKGWLDPNSSNYAQQRNDLLAHETAHVWQYQNGGTDYIAESLWNQAAGALSGGDRSAAYEFEQPIKDGKSWAELNPEQQAHLMEEAYRHGLFDDPNARFVYNGSDYTDYARGAITEMRAGRGAP